MLTGTKTTNRHIKTPSARLMEQANSRPAAADEAIIVALNTAVAVSVALDTAVADPDSGKMSSLTISGDGTTVDITGTRLRGVSSKSLSERPSRLVYQGLSSNSWASQRYRFGETRVATLIHGVPELALPSATRTWMARSGASNCARASSKSSSAEIADAPRALPLAS
jgi:hypothetical protein